MNLAADEVHHVECALVGLPEIDDAKGGVDQFPVFADLVSLVAETPDSSGVIVPIDVGPDDFRQPLAAIDKASGDGAEIGVAVLDHGFQNGRRPQAAIGPEGVAPFLDAPAVVATRLDQVDHFPQVLAYFSGPEISGLAVEVHLPDLAQAVSPDLRTGALAAHKGVVLGNPIGHSGIGVVDVDPQNGGQQVGDILSGITLIGDAAAVPRGNIEIAVGAESETPPVVSAGRPFKDDGFGGGIGLEAVVGPNLEA